MMMECKQRVLAPGWLVTAAIHRWPSAMDKYAASSLNRGISRTSGVVAQLPAFWIAHLAYYKHVCVCALYSDAVWFRTSPDTHYFQTAVLRVYLVIFLLFSFSILAQLSHGSSPIPSNRCPLQETDEICCRFDLKLGRSYQLHYSTFPIHSAVISK